ncbi:hypothetical protein [Roseibacillus ishigakijimensis]
MQAAGGGLAVYRAGVATIPNRASGSNAGSNATQGTATAQPEALPLIGGQGYGHLPGVVGNFFDRSVAFGGGSYTIQYSFLPTWEDQPPTGDHLLTLNHEGANRGSLYVYGENLPETVWGKIESKDVGGSSVYLSEFYDMSPDSLTHVRVIHRAGASTDFYGSTDGVSWSLISSKPHTVSSDPFDAVRLGHTLGHAVTHASLWWGANPAAAPDHDFDFREADHFGSSPDGLSLNASGTNPAAIIGRPTLRTDGVDDYMTVALSEPIGEFSLFAVYKPLGGDAFGRLVSLQKDTNTDNNSTGIIALGSTDVARIAYSGSLLMASPTLNGLVLVESRVSAMSQELFVNGVSVGTSTADLSALSPNKVNLFGSGVGANNHAAFVQEIILAPYNVNREAITAHLLRKYNLPAS